MITAHDQGQIIASILSDPGKHAGQTYRLDGPTRVDGDDIAAALTRSSGRTIRYRPVPVSDFQSAVSKIPRLGSFFAQHIGAIAKDLENGRLEEPGLTLEHFTGATPMSLEEFIRARHDAFEPGQGPSGTA